MGLFGPKKSPTRALETIELILLYTEHARVEEGKGRLDIERKLRQLGDTDAGARMMREEKSGSGEMKPADPA